MVPRLEPDGIETTVGEAEMVPKEAAAGRAATREPRRIEAVREEAAHELLSFAEWWLKIVPVSECLDSNCRASHQADEKAPILQGSVVVK